MPRRKKFMLEPVSLNERLRSLHWDSFCSWIDPVEPSHHLFTSPREPLNRAVASSLWHGYFEGGPSFLFEHYGVLLECAAGVETTIFAGTKATFCVTGPQKDVFTFSGGRADWMCANDVCVQEATRQSAPILPGMRSVADVVLLPAGMTGGRPLSIPPYLGFAVRLDFTDAVLDLQRAGERFKITYIMRGALGPLNETKESSEEKPT